MSELTHTKEPWEACALGRIRAGVEVGGRWPRPLLFHCDQTHGVKNGLVMEHLGQPLAEANALRATACVNAMAGVADPAAELVKLRESEAGAAVMREALETTLKSASPHPMENGVMYEAWTRARKALSTNAGRELLAELEALREHKLITDAWEYTKLIAEVERLRREVNDVRQILTLADEERDAAQKEVERLRQQRDGMVRDYTIVLEHWENAEKERDSLRRKVEAADGMATLCEKVAKKTVKYETRNTMSGDDVTVDTGKPTDAAIEAATALTTWQEANK